MRVTIRLFERFVNTNNRKLFLALFPFYRIILIFKLLQFYFFSLSISKANNFRLPIKKLSGEKQGMMV